MTKNQKVTVTGAKGKNGATTGKNQRGEIVMTQKEMEKLIQTITAETLKAVLSQTLSQNEVPKVTPKKTATARVSKPNPVAERIMQEQAELAQKFNGKDYGSQAVKEFIAFYRKKDNGSYTRIGHFNKTKGLFWFTKKSLVYRDWAYIKAQLTKYSGFADFARNGAKFEKAGIKCPSDFTKVSWETFLNSGVFC